MQKKASHINFEDSIGPWLGRTVKLIEYHMQEQFKANDVDLTKEQMIVLKRVTNHDGLSQNELAFLTLRNKSSLTRLLSKMEKKQYIKRKQSKVDKRINEVYITPTGESVFKKAQPILKSVINTIESGISHEKKQFMISTLKTIQNNFNSKEETI